MRNAQTIKPTADDIAIASAQTIKPTADDMALAFFRYGEAKNLADADYRRRTGKAAGEQRWVKRD